MSIEQVGALIGSLTHNEAAIMVVFIAWSFILFMYLDKKQYFRDIEKNAIDDANRKSVKRCDDLLHQVQAISMRRVRKLISNIRRTDRLCERSSIGSPCVHSDSYWDSLVVLMQLTLDRSLFGSLRSFLKFKIYNNGFHELEGKDLDDYVKEHAKEALELSRGIIAATTANTPLADIPDDDRFTLEEAIGLMRELIDSSKTYYEQGMSRVKKEKDKYKLFGRNIF